MPPTIDFHLLTRLYNTKLEYSVDLITSVLDELPALMWVAARVQRTVGKTKEGSSNQTKGFPTAELR